MKPIKIIEIQDKLWKHIGKENYYQTVEEFKDSILIPRLKNHNILMDALNSPAILPLFNPLDLDEFLSLISEKNDATAFNSEGNTALLMALDKGIEPLIVEKLLTVSDIKHKNNDGVNALTLAILNQKTLPTSIVHTIVKNSDSFTLTKRGLSDDFFSNRNISLSVFEYQHLSLKKICKKYEEKQASTPKNKHKI